MALTACAMAHAAPKSPKPVVRLPLQSMGFPGVSQNFIDAGASMLTVHFVDDEHLLVTYSLRGLVERVPEDAPEDESRAVAALLIETNSGKVLARARWHLHDHAQYLWPLGGGRFMLRVRDSLRAIAPMENFAGGEAFHETPLVRVTGQLDLVQVSADGELVTLETSPRPKKVDTKTPAPVTFSGAPAAAKPLEEISFVRIVGKGSAASPVRAIVAGSTRATSPGVIPVTGRGYLFANRRGLKSDWDVRFDSYDGGEATKLAPIMSSCAPRLQFVGPAQFVALTCRGSDDQMMLSSYDFLPRETWEEPLSGAVLYPYFASSAKAGRFAVSRHVMHAADTAAQTAGFVQSTVPDVPVSGDVQEIRVYQAESGDLLLRLDLTPAMRAGQNFDLSPDGMSALVVRSGVVEVYRLPELKKEDRQDLAEVAAHEPPVSKADKVELRRAMKQAVATAEEAPVAAPPASTPAADPAASSAAGSAQAKVAVPASQTIQYGDAPPNARTAPPSLLAPGESKDDSSDSKKPK